MDSRMYDDVGGDRRNSQGSHKSSSGSATTDTDDMEDEDEYSAFATDLKEFTYPYPIKLRELQGMVRPFMEVKSSHHIAGLDAIISETVRGFLALFQHIEAWDRTLMTLLERLSSDPEKDVVKKGAPMQQESSRMRTIGELCATLQMDGFEMSHRLFQVDTEKFFVDPLEIEMLCNKYPSFQEQNLLRGLPQAQAYGRAGSHECRVESLSWWRENHFGAATPTRILATTILGELLESGLHPDPHVADVFPRVFEALFGVQILRS